MKSPHAFLTFSFILLGTFDAQAVPGQAGEGLPLKPARTIEFTTDEATWMSLDVTPDGQFIFFDLLGDLYRLPIGGGKATRVTSGMAYDRQPRVSPDGQWLAFVSDRSGIAELWIQKLEGGELRKITATVRGSLNANDYPSRKTPIGPVWSPDSKSILVRTTESGKLMLYQIDGNAGIALQGGLNANAYPEAVFDHTGHQLYGPKGRQIVRWDLVSGREVTVTEVESILKAFSPWVSPHGDILVYMTTDYDETRYRIHKLDLASGADSVVAYTSAKTPDGYMSARTPGYDFMPDGKSVLMTEQGKIRRIDITTGASNEIAFTADVSLELGPLLDVPQRVEQGPVRARIVQDPRLSPDGRTLAFSVLTKIYTMAMPGGPPKRLTRGDGGEYKPVWSPDGQWIAYVSWSQGGGHVWKVRANGRGEPQRLTRRAAHYTNISFSPDATKILALRDGANLRQHYPGAGGFDLVSDPTFTPFDIILLPSSGGEAQVVTEVSALTTPQFSADAQRIHFYVPLVTGAEISKGNLMSTQLDGSDRRIDFSVLNTGSGDFSYDKTVELSPDGRWALVRVRDQLYVLSVTVVGVPGPDIDVESPAFAGARLTDIGASYFSWAQSGATITWSIGSTCYRQNLASVDFSQGRAPPKMQPREHDAPAQSLTIDMDFPRMMPRGTLVLRHATVLVDARRPAIEDADIVIDGNRIVAVGPSGQVALPAGALQKDLRGKFIVPGFIDTHAHWNTVKTYGVLEPQSWDLAANLAYGITTSMNVQTNHEDAFIYQDLAATGQTLAPRLYSTGLGIFSGDPGVFNSYEETLHHLRRYKDHFRTYYLKAYEVGPRQGSQWLVMAAKELGLMATAHPGLEKIIDGYSGHEHLPFAWPMHKDMAELFARSGTSMTPTLIAGAIQGYYEELDLAKNPKFNHFTPPNFLPKLLATLGGVTSGYYEKRRWQGSMIAAQIQRAGGLVGVGSHGNVPGIQYHMEMWAMALNMTPREVLQAATIDGARILRLDRDVGSLEAGKIADLLVLDGNPLQNLRNTNSIRYVMRNGEMFEGDTLDRVWPARMPAPSFWWHKPGTPLAEGVSR